MEKLNSQLYKLIFRKYGFDLSGYSCSFFEKAIQDRKSHNKMSNDEDYLKLVQNNDSEAISLINEISVPYTHFFRSALTFSMIEKQLIPEIIKNKKDKRELRIWSAGCSTGEEAFSLAVIIDHYISKHEIEMNYRIFASDISEKALSSAKKGIYALDAIENVPIKYVEKYFFKKGSSYCVNGQIKEHVHFINYNLLDQGTITPPECIFGEFDIIMCSNVLIYFNSESQRFVLKKLHKGLAHEGYLITGQTEKSTVKNFLNHEPLKMMSAIFKL